MSDDGRPQQWVRSGDGGLGTAAFVLGILALVGYCVGPLAGLIAMVLGSIVLIQSRSRPVSTRGLALWGLVMGAVGFVVWSALLIIALR